MAGPHSGRAALPRRPGGVPALDGRSRPHSLRSAPERPPPEHRAAASGRWHPDPGRSAPLPGRRPPDRRRRSAAAWQIPGKWRQCGRPAPSARTSRNRNRRQRRGPPSWNRSGAGDHPVRPADHGEKGLNAHRLLRMEAPVPIALYQLAVHCVMDIGIGPVRPGYIRKIRRIGDGDAGNDQQQRQRQRKDPPAGPVKHSQHPPI